MNEITISGTEGQQAGENAIMAQAERAGSLALKAEAEIIVGPADVPDFSALVPEDEAAEPIEGELERMKRFKSLGFFSPVRGMVQIQNFFDGRVYARVYADDKGMRYIEYCQKYSSGKFSPKMSLAQADMKMAAKYRFLSKGIEEPKVRSRVANFVLNAYSEYLGKFHGDDDDELDIMELLNVIQAAMAQMPGSQMKTAEDEAWEFYQGVEYCILNVPVMPLEKHKAYYAFDYTSIGRIAHAMNMKNLELLRKLEQYGFLYLTDSSKGYQANVRLKDSAGKNFTEWMYCIYKLGYFAGIEEPPEQKDEIEF